ADDLVVVVDRECPGASTRVPPRRREAGHGPVLPDESMRHAALVGAVADDLAAVGNPRRNGPLAAKRAEVGHRAVAPEERVRLVRPDSMRPDHLATLVERSHPLASPDVAASSVPPHDHVLARAADDFPVIVNRDRGPRPEVGELSVLPLRSPADRRLADD